MPQHPPTKAAPAISTASICPTNSCASISYSVLPSESTGRPAFGFTTTGMSDTSTIRFTSERSLSGPAEQFRPIASAPIPPRTTAQASGVLPKKVCPSSRKVSVIITGSSQTSRMASSAMRHSFRFIMVSTTNRSAPALTQHSACSL